MKLKYVGLKDKETAFSPETGITWTPGASHTVPDGMARRMLAHPDVFALDESVEATMQAPVVTDTETSNTPPTGDTPAAPEFVMGTADGPLVLDGMDRETLMALAKEAGMNPHPKTGVAKLQALLVEKFPLKAD